MRDDWRGDGRMPISFRARIVAGGGGGGPTLPEVASATLLLNLQVDTLSLNDGDPVATWPDASGNNRDFAQANASLRPDYHENLGVKYVEFPVGMGKALTGPVFADNLDSFTVFVAYKLIPTSSTWPPIIQKYEVAAGTGWEVDAGYYFYIVKSWDDETEVDSLHSIYDPPDTTPRVVTHELVSKTNLHLYVDGADVSNDGSFGNEVTDYSNTVPVLIGWPATLAGSNALQIYSIMMYAPAPNASDRAAIENWLAARYGITLP